MYRILSLDIVHWMLTSSLRSRSIRTRMHPCAHLYLLAGRGILVPLHDVVAENSQVQVRR
jgi:hypothetical protein